MNITLIVYFVLTFIVGLAIGAVFLRFRVKGSLEKAEKVEGLESKIQDQEQELDSFKEEVSDHFVETASLVNQMTQSYKAVYEHLEKGAYKLVGEENLQKRLADVQAELEFIGQPRLTDEVATTELDVDEAITTVGDDVPEEVSVEAEVVNPEAEVVTEVEAVTGVEAVTEVKESSKVEVVSEVEKVSEVEVVPEAEKVSEIEAVSSEEVETFVLELLGEFEGNEDAINAIASTLKMTPEKTQEMLERAPGVITKGISEEKAKEIQSVFNEQGLTAVINKQT